MISKLRLISGLILFVFVLSHFYTHALGLISSSAMNNGLFYTVVYWRTPIGGMLLMSALVVHVALSAYSLLQKRSFKLAPVDWVQIITGLLIPIMLAAHVLGTRGGYEKFGLEEGYKFQFYFQWVSSPIYAYIITASMFVVWAHACIGWHQWFKYNAFYNRIKLFLLGLAVLIPTLAFGGIITNGFRTTRLARNDKWVARVTEKVSPIADEFRAFVDTWEMVIILSVISFVALVAGLHFLRKWLDNRSRNAGISYSTLHSDTQSKIKLRTGASLLDMIRESDIDHASVCGGRGRCSTCRVRIASGGEELDTPSSLEATVLSRLEAGPDVRLACQLTPRKPISVVALLDPKTAGAPSRNNSRHDAGQEQEIAVLFADIRSFTKLSEGQLPYDTAFMLNRYFAAMGQAIEGAGGHLDKFIGDGVMALFGVDSTPEEACEKAINAAIAMSERLEQLNQTLANDIGQEIRIGIGIHFGTAIVGNMGYGKATGLTAIGDVVNTASRLEGLTKDHGVQLIVSKKLAALTNRDFKGFEKHKTEIRGRKGKLDIFAIQKGTELKASALA